LALSDGIAFPSFLPHFQSLFKLFLVFTSGQLRHRQAFQITRWEEDTQQGKVSRDSEGGRSRTERKQTDHPYIVRGESMAEIRSCTRRIEREYSMTC